MEFLREPVSVVRDMEDRKAGHRSEVLFCNAEEFLGGVEAAPGGHHGSTDERLDRVNVRFEFQVQDKGTGVVRMDIRLLLQLVAEMESALLLQDADNFPPFLRRLKADAHQAVLFEVVFHFAFPPHLFFACEEERGRFMCEINVRDKRSNPIVPTGLLLCLGFIASYRSSFGTLPCGRLSCGQRACLSRTLHRRLLFSCGMIIQDYGFIRKLSASGRWFCLRFQ